MPTMNNYLNFVYVNLGFLSQILVMTYFKSAIEIKENWALYRCNPPYWIFSDNIGQDFNYCVQNTQLNMMGYLLQPMNYLISSLTSMGSGISDSINNVRVMFSTIRTFISSIIENIFGVFLNMIIEFQKMIISIKDMVGKMIGIVATMMYILDGSIKTMNSAWSGPPGQMVKAIGSCFHPDTEIQIKNGDIFAMKDIPLGSELMDGSKVFAILKIANFDNVPLYKLNKGVNGGDIYVTGNHFIKYSGKWIQVKDCKEAIIQPELNLDWFSCIITTKRRIQIGERKFWDWEDDELLEKYTLM